MARDERTYIQVHDGMPDHPKIDGLSDGAFRLLVTMWCWCSRHQTDGYIPAGTWIKRGTAKARTELAAEMVHASGHTCCACPDVPAGKVLMHDYLKHQRSAAEIAALKEKRQKAGAAGGKAKAQRLASAKQVVQQNGSKPVPATDTATEGPNGPNPSEPAVPRGAAAPTDVNAGTVVAAWVDAFKGSTKREPSASMKAQAGREARQLLETGADPTLVLDAAKAVGGKGMATIEREFAPLVARRNRVPADVDPDQVLGPDHTPLPRPPLEIEEGPPDQRRAWYEARAAERRAQRVAEARRVLQGGSP